jgi:hypothetical protein
MALIGRIIRMSNLPNKETPFGTVIVVTGTGLFESPPDTVD